MRFVHQEHDLVVENNIMGIQLKIIKSRSSEDVGDSTRLDVQMDFSEIHVWILMFFKLYWYCSFYNHVTASFINGDFFIIFQLLREAGTSVLEILKVDVVSFLYIPIQVSSFS